MKMTVYVADDERLILNSEVKIISQVLPDAEIKGFRSGTDILAAAAEKPCSIAFLDIHMMDMTGIEVAEELKKLCPRVNIIFVTAYDDYFRNAMELHASGYLLKPISEEDIRKELSELRYGLPTKEEEEKTEAKPKALLKVTCFGNFDVQTMEGERLHFERLRSKEAFAYLVHLHGTPCTLRELAASLFEDEPFDKKNQMYIQKILSSMMKTLRNYGAEAVVEKNFNSLAVVPSLLDCDYYREIEAKPDSRYNLPEDYMMQYSWIYH